MRAYTSWKKLSEHKSCLLRFYFLSDSCVSNIKDFRDDMRAVKSFSWNILITFNFPCSKFEADVENFFRVASIEHVWFRFIVSLCINVGLKRTTKGETFVFKKNYPSSYLKFLVFLQGKIWESEEILLEKKGRKSAEFFCRSLTFLLILFNFKFHFAFYVNWITLPFYSQKGCFWCKLRSHREARKERKKTENWH